MYCGVIITTNHLASGIYIPPDDRRYDVIEAATMHEMGLVDESVRREYFIDLWEWFLAGGSSHIAAYLHERDLSNFSASNGQRKTDAHRAVVAGGMTGDQWLDDILDELGDPIGVRADWIITKAVAAGEKDADVKRKLGNAIGRVGYTLFKNKAMKDGRWKIGGKKVTVYVKQGTPESYDPTKQLGAILMFDPFDERNRDKQKRRKPSEVEFDRKQRVERLDNHFRRAMDALDWPDFVQSNWLLNEMSTNEATNMTDRMLRRNVESAMKRLGWVKILNPKSKDGRWSNCGENFFVYGKEGMANVVKSELKQQLGW